MSKYTVVQSDIDFKWRVMQTRDVPYGVCFSIGNTKEDAIRTASFLGIKRSEIQDY